MPTSFHEYKRYQHRSAVRVLMLEQPKVAQYASVIPAHSENDCRELHDETKLRT